jgi:hypothetical protein
MASHLEEQAGCCISSKSYFRTIHLKDAGIAAGSTPSRRNAGSWQETEFHQPSREIAGQINAVDNARFALAEVGEFTARNITASLERPLDTELHLRPSMTPKSAPCQDRGEPLRQARISLGRHRISISNARFDVKIHAVPEIAPKATYSRQEVRRLLAITERQLKGWEQHSLIRHTETFGFSDLIALRALIKLRESRIPPAKIRSALAAVRERLRTVDDPLKELKVLSDGKRIRV